jgi:hypothetical protein
LLFISFLPIFRSKDYLKSQRDRWKNTLSKDNLRFLGGYVVEGINSALFFWFWPFYIFLLFQNGIPILGASASINVLGVIIFSLLIGRESDTKLTSKILKLSAATMAMIWLAWIFIDSVAMLFIIVFLTALIDVSKNIPFRKYAFSKIKERGIEGGLIFRDFGIFLGRMLTAGLFILSGALFPTSFYVVFLLAALSCVYFLLVKMG